MKKFENFEYNIFFISFSIISLLCCFIVTPAFISLFMPAILLSFKPKE